MKILITCALESRTYKIINQLEGHALVLADYGEVPKTPGSNEFVSLGIYNPDTIAHQLLSACLDVAADVCIPLSSSEVAATAVSKTLFEEFNIRLLVPDSGGLHELSSSGAAGPALSFFWKGADLLTGEPVPVAPGDGVYFKDSEGYKLFIARA